MALTVYSACFFPYHFIHFLNSRSMVCKGTTSDSPSEIQNSQEGRGTWAGGLWLLEAHSTPHSPPTLTD